MPRHGRHIGRHSEARQFRPPTSDRFQDGIAIATYLTPGVLKAGVRDWVDAEPKARRKPDDAEHAQRVVQERHERVGRCADNALAKIVEALIGTARTRAVLGTVSNGTMSGVDQCASLPPGP